MFQIWFWCRGVGAVSIFSFSLHSLISFQDKPSLQREMTLRNSINQNKCFAAPALYTFLSIIQLSSMVIFDLIYIPVLILASLGFSALSGIAHVFPIIKASGTRPSLHKIWILLGDIPHRSDVCFTDKYFMNYLVPWILLNSCTYIQKLILHYTR